LVVLDGLGLALKEVPLEMLVYDTPLIIKLKGPVPEEAVKVNCPVAPEQMIPPARLPWGKGLTVMVADAPVIPDVRTQEFASVMEVSV
jgi:hypothetical protein